MGVARPLRYLPGQTLVEVTCRTLHGRLLLRPSAVLDEALLGAIGRAQRIFGLKIVAITALSNHLHILALPDDAEQLADAMEYFLSKLAREVGRLYAWREKVWGRRYRAIPISEEPEAQVERLRYLLENGTKERLVAHPRDWPGVHSVAALVDGDDLVGVWTDRTAEYKARRKNRELLPGENQAREVVALTPLPCWAHLSEGERRRRAAELVDDIAAAAKLARRGAAVLGPEKVLRQAPHQRPSHPDRSPAPAVHAASKAIRIAMKAAYRAFLLAYRYAADQLRKGNRMVAFPPGSFPPSLPVVPWATG
jgi:hypothetical protein